MSESENAKLIADELRRVAALYRHAGHPHGIEPLLDKAADALEAAEARNAEHDRVIAEQAHDRGYDACKAGMQRFRNPYRANPEAIDSTKETPSD